MSLEKWQTILTGKWKPGYKRCWVCKQYKPLSEFWKGQDACKPCKLVLNKEWRKEHPRADAKYQRRWRQKNSVRSIYVTLKQSAKRRGLPLKFSLKEFKSWYRKQPKLCVYCGISEEEWGLLQQKTGEGHAQRLSIDRIDSNQGYEQGNLVLACMRCNTVKSYLMTFDEMRRIGQEILRPKWKEELRGITEEERGHE